MVSTASTSPTTSTSFNPLSNFQLTRQHDDLWADKRREPQSQTRRRHSNSSSQSRQTSKQHQPDRYSLPKATPQSHQLSNLEKPDTQTRGDKNPKGPPHDALLFTTRKNHFFIFAKARSQGRRERNKTCRRQILAFLLQTISSSKPVPVSRKLRGG